MVNNFESFIRNKDEFSDFLKILNYCSGMSNDLHIVDRKVLQRVDARVAIIKCDLSNLLEFDGELVFYNIPKIVKNLKGLAKKSPIRFKRLEDSILVKDTITSIFISLGLAKYCDNKKMTEAEFDDSFELGPMFLECEIDKSLCNVVSNYSKINNKHAINMSIRSNTAALRYGEIGGQNIKTEFKVNYKLKNDMPDCDIILPAMIFDIKAETTLRIYFDTKSSEENSVAVCIFTIFINENINLEIYTRTNIRKEEKKDEET